MISFDDAMERLALAVRPLGSQPVSLAEAAGRYAAQPIAARADSPPRDVSAMDGYAVKLDMVRTGEWMAVAGESRPGLPRAGNIGPGEAMRIFTGGALPAGADCVIMQEYAERAGDKVRFSPGFGPARHVRAAGSDFRAGTELVAKGVRLSPQAMVAAAAADRAEIQVSLRPRVAIIATGDELAPPGAAHDRPGTVPDSASHGVAALASQMGAELVLHERAPDTLAVLEAVAGRALATADCVVVIGGASVGERDFARAMFSTHGLELVFSRIAIRPGKPVWLGQAAGRWVIGLPGNPTSALVTARLFLRPLLAAMQGGLPDAELGFMPLPLAAPLAETGSRETFVRASLGAEGLAPVGNQESGAQSPLTAADWLIRRPPHAPAAASGETVLALSF